MDSDGVTPLPEMTMSQIWAQDPTHSHGHIVMYNDDDWAPATNPPKTGIYKIFSFEIFADTLLLLQELDIFGRMLTINSEGIPMHTLYLE